MNTKVNKKTSRRAQLSLELGILIAVVAVIAILVGFLYLNGVSKSNVGTNNQLLAVGVDTSSANTIVVAFNKPLPTTIASPSLISSAGTATLTISSTNLASPTYVDNYPEYTFTVQNGIEPSSGSAIVSFQYTSSSGQSISILPAGNVTAQSVSTTAVQP